MDRVTTFAGGIYVLPVAQSAMFDPEAFENPEQVFQDATGIPFPLRLWNTRMPGKYVGMVMIPEVVRQILLQISEQRVASITKVAIYRGVTISPGAYYKEAHCSKLSTNRKYHTIDASNQTAASEGIGVAIKFRNEHTSKSLFLRLVGIPRSRSVID
jgi:hypothetical protein